MAHPGGRPPKYTAEVKAELLEQLEKYVQDTECPFIEEFATLSNTYAQRLYEFPEFAETLKKAKNKRESYFQRVLIQGKSPGNNPIPIIFMLKSMHGYRDSTAIVGDKDSPVTIKVEIDSQKVEDAIQAKLRKYKQKNTSKGK